jgi:pimeloyl-ACP methyl ester carboxylesterase
MRKISFVLFLFLVFTLAGFAQNGKQTTQSKFADFGGTKVHYNSVGKGSKAIVFIHGWNCNADVWKDSVNAFPEYRVIAIDLPGHGQSDKPKTDYTMDYFAKSVEAVLKDAKVGKAVLVGHSMGTPVARQFYRLYPKKTLGIVIVDGLLRWIMDKASSDAFYTALRADYKTTSTQFVDGVIQPVKDEKLKKFIRDTMLSAPDYVGRSAMESFQAEKLWDTDKINVPVLAIMAESPWWASDTDEFYASLAPNLDFRMWQGVSHFLMMEQPEVFNKAVKLYVAKNNLL